MFKLSDYTKYRILEIIPGLLVWGTLLGSLALSIFKPLWGLYFIMIFDLYWVLRVLYVLSYLILAFRKYQKAIRENWLQKAQKLSRFDDIYHLIFLPTYHEGPEIVEPTFEGLQNANYPKDKIIIIYAVEERNKDFLLPIAESIQKKYGHLFKKFLITIHPSDIPGEIKGKGSNMHYAGKQAQKLVDQLNIPYENIVVSCFDIDTVVHKEYFGHLTHTYLTHPNPTRSSYQPVLFYNNNIWDAPAPMRIASMGTSFWLMTEQLRPERLFTASSHSLSFRALVDAGFHQNDVVTEDSRIFLQCLLRYDGDYTVTPLYIPVSMDTVMSSTLRGSLKNLYKQQRRWAWGVEHFPYMVWNFHKNKKISLHKKFHYTWTLLEGMYSWATVPIIITILGRIPLAFMSAEEKRLAIVQSAPFIIEHLLNVALIFLVALAIFSIIVLPPPPTHKKNPWSILIMVFQWVLFPFSIIIFGSIPAIEAHTRLMFGKYLGFHVTDKARKIK